MRKLKKYVAIGCATMIVLTAVGCSSTTETTSTSAETTQEETATTDSSASTTASSSTTEASTDKSKDASEQGVEGKVVFGKVTAIEGTEVTLALGEMPQGKDMGGKAPNDANSSNTENTTKTDATTENKKPDGDAPSGNTPSGEAPSKEAPSGNAPSGEAPDMSSMFEASGETLTITADESLIKVMSAGETSTGSLSDITVDTILSIAYDDADNITSITIQSTTK